MNYAETIQTLIGTIDGANTDFTVPTQFELGSTRGIVNGLTYEPGDEQWGHSELNETTVRFVNAPKVGFRLQMFYREPIAEGSPHHPSDTYP